MAFLADLATIMIVLIYLNLNRKLFVWRLATAEKYPYPGSIHGTFKDILRGGLEFVISAWALCGLLIGLFISLFWPMRFSHEFVQIALLPAIIYWAYTFTFIVFYPTSSMVVNWFKKSTIGRHFQ